MPERVSRRTRAYKVTIRPAQVLGARNCHCGLCEQGEKGARAPLADTTSSVISHTVALQRLYSYLLSQGKMFTQGTRSTGIR